MKQFLAFCLILLSFSSQGQYEGKWKQLFNGKTLDGWIVKIRGHELNENFGNTFRVEDGILKVRYDEYDSFDNQYGHIFYHSPFAYYVVVVEYRFTGNQVKGGPDWAFKNSGIMLHCQSPSTMLKNQDFPVSIEAQLLGGDTTGERPTCNVCTPGTNIVMNGKLITDHCVRSSSKTFRGEEWVRAEVVVLGDSIIKHVVNGDTVLIYTRPKIGGGNVADYDTAIKKDGELLSSGYISLQSESHPVDFRKIEIMDLTDQFDQREKINSQR